ncbi:MAG: hypothetical protein WC621_05260 [Patescibacteria group bacterium]
MDLLKIGKFAAIFFGLIEALPVELKSDGYHIEGALFVSLCIMLIKVLIEIALVRGGIRLFRLLRIIIIRFWRAHRKLLMYIIVLLSVLTVVCLKIVDPGDKHQELMIIPIAFLLWCIILRFKLFKLNVSKQVNKKKFSLITFLGRFTFIYETPYRKMTKAREKLVMYAISTEYVGLFVVAIIPWPPVLALAGPVAYNQIRKRYPWWRIDNWFFVAFAAGCLLRMAFAVLTVYGML